MKKLIALSILFTVLAVGAFAQFKVAFEANFYPELLRATAPLDDFADGDKAYAGSGTLNFFNTHQGWNNNGLNFKLSYTDPDKKYSALIQFEGNRLIRGTTGEDAFTKNRKDDATIQNFTDMLRLGDYELKGTVGKFDAFLGNTAIRGKVDRLTGPTNNFMDGLKQDGLGVHKYFPGINFTSMGLVDAGAFNMQEVPSLAKYPRSGVTAIESGGSPTGRYSPLASGDLAYGAVTANFQPIYVILSGGVNTDLASGATKSYSAANAGIVISAVDLVPSISFDVVYKFSGADPNTDTVEVGDGGQGIDGGDGRGVSNHVFGLYAGINAVPDLKLTVGYAGQFSAREPTDNIDKVDPYFSGIDLRATYTGIDKLTISSNHNISFSSIKGSDPADVDTAFLSGSQASNLSQGISLEDYSESMIALYNTLCLAYKVTDGFTAGLNVINRFGSFTADRDGDENVAAGDRLQISAIGSYTLTSNVLLEAGLAFRIDHGTFTPSSGTELKGGTFTFGIPLHLKVAF